MQSAMSVVLPVFDPQIPLTVVAGADSAETMIEEYLIKRFQQGLPTVAPVPDVHGSVDEVILATLMKLCGRKPLSETHLMFVLDPAGYPLAPESMDGELGEHFACYLQENIVNIRAGVLALNEAEEGLGSEVFARLSSLADGLPGMVSDRAVLELYNDFRLEGMMTEECSDEEIREHLIANHGYDEEGIDEFLPSTILREMGGKDLVNFTPVRKTRALTQGLERACPEIGKRLAQLLCSGIKSKVNAFHKIRSGFKDETFAPFYDSLCVRLTAAPQNSRELAIGGFLDDLKNDAMNSGDYDATFAINHFESDRPMEEPETKRPRKRKGAMPPSPSAVMNDSLNVIAKLIVAMSAIDEAICLINQIGEKKNA